jgi:hypothetical protein
MSRRRKWFYIMIIGVASLTLLGLCAATARWPDSTIQFSNDIPAYKQLLEPSEHLPRIAYSIQAAPLLETGVIKAYRTDFISTVVIAVDRDQVQDEITGWKSLNNGNYVVSFAYKGKLSHIDFGYVILSMMAGLDDLDSNPENTIRLLGQLSKSGRLVSAASADVPVAILFDYQAAQLALAGKNIEIIVPAEGTLSFPAGIMSVRTGPLPAVNRADLIAAGFRLPDGGADASVYPAAAAYASASQAIMSPASAWKVLRAIAMLRRQIHGERRFSTANGAENMLVYLLFIIFAVFWSGALYQRISDKTLQTKLFLIVALVLFWMLTRIVRLVLPVGATDRFLWYLFYIPLTFLPLILFRIGQALTGHTQLRYSRLVWRASVAVSILLTGFVLTNDLHQMAFYFYRGTEGNNYDLYYSYGWVYYVIFAWSIMLIHAFVIMTVSKKPRAPSRQAVSLIVLLILSMGYFGGYALGITVLRESEFSIVYGIIALLFLEICFRSRLIPNNTRLGELLHNAPIDLQILSDNMQIEYRTGCAAQLPAEVIEQIGERRPAADEPLGLVLPRQNSILYGVYRIDGGYTVVTQHRDTVFKLHAALAGQNKKIKAQNSILNRTSKIQGEITRLKTQQELLTSIDTVLHARIKQINTIYHNLPDCGTDEHQDLVKKQLASIKMLVNYCKRRGNLALMEAGDEYCDTAALALWLQESIWEVGAAGIDGMVRHDGQCQIHSSQASLLYDSFAQILETAMNYSRAVLAVHLSMQEQAPVLSIVVETEPAAEATPFAQALHGIPADIEWFAADANEDGLRIHISDLQGGLEYD